jgi:hypothetical protein
MRRAAFLIIILVLAIGILGPETARAQPSAGATWSSDIIYFNLSSIPSGYKNLTIAFNNNGTTIPGKTDKISYQYFSNTILAGAIGQNFAGSAVLSAEVPVVAVYKQVSSSSNPYSPILYSSFTADQAGNGIFYIPSVQRNPAFVSQVGIQNVEAVPLDLTLNFYAVGSSTPAFTATKAAVPSQSSYVFKLSDLSNCPLTFNGSLVITATPSTPGSSTTANIVAVVQEVQSNGRQAYASEGAASGAGTIYMPSAMCNVGKTQQTTFYAIQNAGASDGTATITYYDGLGNTVANMTTGTIHPNSKVSVSTCDKAVVANTSGKSVLSAVITGNGIVLVAMGKVQSTDGLMTAFLGFQQPTTARGDGSYHVALPYVEWSNSTLGFHTYIAVMNASGAPETNITVNYYPRNGAKAPVGKAQILANSAMPLAANAKRNSEPDQVNGALNGSKSFLGAVEVVSDQPVVVIVRVQRGVSGIPGVTTLGEDYSGINVPKDPG